MRCRLPRPNARVSVGFGWRWRLLEWARCLRKGAGARRPPGNIPMMLGALSAGAVDTMNGMPTGPDSQGNTYGTMADGTSISCPPGRPYDPVLMDCSGVACLPMVSSLDSTGNVVYSLPQGPLQPGQSVCPAPYQGVAPGSVTLPEKQFVAGIPNWLLIGGIALAAGFLFGGRR